MLRRSLWLALVALPSACATVAVPPGHGAVLMTADGAFSVLGEGVAAVPESSQVDDFNLREQVQGGSFTAITADGMSMVVRDPAITYRLAADELIAIDRTLGRDGWQSLVQSIVQSAVTGAIAQCRWSELDSPRIREVQARISELASLRLRPHHLESVSVELKGISPRLPGLASAVTETSVWEARSAEAKTKIEVARKRADNLRAEAAGIAAANRRLSPSLNAAILTDERDKAWARLLDSPNTTIQVVDEQPASLEVLP